MNVCDSYVGCGFCMGEQTVREALDACFRSGPSQSLVAFRCPTCGEVNHLLVQKDSVREGYLDGFPGPAFVTKRAILLERFRVKCMGDCIAIKNVNLSWSIPSTPVGESP